VTSTDADGNPPPALTEFLRSLPEQPIELLKAVLVVVDPAGRPISTEWIDGSASR